MQQAVKIIAERVKKCLKSGEACVTMRFTGETHSKIRGRVDFKLSRHELCQKSGFSATSPGKFLKYRNI
jgi:hypothetical protein